MRTLSLIVPVYNAPALVRTLLGRVPELERAAAACGFRLVETILVELSLCRGCLCTLLHALRHIGDIALLHRTLEARTTPLYFFAA